MARRSVLSRLAAGTLLVALGFGLGVAWSARAEPASPSLQARPAPLPPELEPHERATISLFERSSPSVCFLTSITYRRRSLFSLRADAIPSGTGSGFIWDRDGHVVTNYHVIRGAGAAQVTLAEQTTWDAELVGAAPEEDLAVLRIEAPREKLVPLAVGSSAPLRVGQNVYAIGNPFGLDQTLTTGVISALGREIESLAGIAVRGVIQTDAAINPTGVRCRG